MMQFHILEWVFETLNKRVSQGFKIQDLFLVLPFNEESEIIWDMFSIFNKHGKTQGNDLEHDYPKLYEIFKKSINGSEMRLRVFFVSRSRLQNPVICHVKKFAYPKVNQLIKTPLTHLIRMN